MEQAVQSFTSSYILSLFVSPKIQQGRQIPTLDAIMIEKEKKETKHCPNFDKVSNSSQFGVQFQLHFKNLRYSASKVKTTKLNTNIS